MSGYQQITIIGRLSRDPECAGDGNSKRCKLSVPTSRKYNDKSGQAVEKTEWHNVTVWGKLADLCEQYLAKGRLVCVVGEVETSEYERDGVKHRRHEIRANTVQFLDKGNTAQADGDDPVPASAPKSDVKVDDDIPF